MERVKVIVLQMMKFKTATNENIKINNPALKGRGMLFW
jgi:hypothetical protein